MNNNQTKRLYKTRARRGREKLNKELDKQWQVLKAEREEMKEIGKNWVLKNINRIKNYVYM